MSRTFRRKKEHNENKPMNSWQSFLNMLGEHFWKLPDWKFHNDSFDNNPSYKMLKKRTRKRSRQENIGYDEFNDEISTKYHRNDDKWNYD